MTDEWRRAHEQTTMVGWDFSVLDGRLRADDPWWDFDADCRAALASARATADLGTGGGERLYSFLAEMDLTGTTVVATEGWEPNVAVARETLAPWGVDVVRYDAEARERMPFDDASLDLVISRHEGIDVAEVARVLAPGGRLLTQQVDGGDAPEIHAWFGSPFEYPDVTSTRYAEDAEVAGLRIDVVDDWSGTIEFADVTALVTYLALVPWDAPNFSVDEHAEQLTALDAESPIRVTQRRFRVYATKP